MPELIDVLKYLNDFRDIPLIDVRSPSEFRQGHIPGAISIPLFNDNERAEVGTIYKQKGNFSAVLRGLDIVGPKMSDMVTRAKELAQQNQLAVHCWRGGMRSTSMAWLFEAAGMNCFVLRGGYKSYRTALRNCLRKPRKLIILGGMTGSGKSDILRKIHATGHQVIDLETLANHKGSAFGGLGRGQQPTTEQFENNLFEQIRKFDPDNTIWIEDESKKIGSVFVPDELFFQMREAKVIKIIVPLKERIKRLVSEYSCFSNDELLESLEKIKKRFGAQNLQPAADAILNSDFEQAASLILQYYDRTYTHGLSKREQNEILELNLDSIDPEMNAQAIIRFAEAVCAKSI